jgi:hypothetical protein
MRQEKNPSSFEKERLIKEEIVTLSSQIFAMWDRENEGVVFSDDILSSSGFDDAEFGLALARILGGDSFPSCSHSFFPLHP